MDTSLIFDRIQRQFRQASNSGTGIVDLAMLNPDLAPARFLLDKLLEASFKQHNHRYAVSRGIRKLREAFALKYERAFAVHLDPEEHICVCMGTKDALLQALVELAQRSVGIRPRVLLARPAYLAHDQLARLAGFETSYFDVSGDSRHMLLQIEQLLSENPTITVILLNFPHNPSGIVVERDFYQGLSKLVQARAQSGTALFVLNDFVYGEMRFDGKAGVSLLSEPALLPYAAESYSLSKAYSVPGWRIGALVGNSQLVLAVSRLKSQKDYGIFLPIQIAAAAALSSQSDIVSPVVREYRERCRIVSQGFRSMGDEQMRFGCFEPQAGGSVWIKLPQSVSGALASLGTPGESISLQFVEELCRTEGVLAMPGRLFGDDFDDYIRLAMVASQERLREVCARVLRCAAAIEMRHTKKRAVGV